MIVTSNGTYNLWSDWCFVAFFIVAGTVTILWSWREWQRTDSIKPGSYWYNIYEGHYKATHWVHRKDFSKISSGYIRRQARRGIMMGILAIIFGVGFGIVKALYL